MFKKFFPLIIVFICLGSISAQKFSGKINPVQAPGKLNVASGDTLKILAVMINFQQDKDETTFGNGKFGSIYTKDYGKTILDPLPHDKPYFDAHLEFVQNYFAKVSNGNLNISYNVLPDTLSVSQTMRNYSPPNNSDDFTSLGNFSKEVWTLADVKYPGFNFSDYDVFIIFHAGVGRDVSLPGSLGNEKDLPSLYLGINSLKKIYGSSYTGFPVSGGFNIPNSLIMPETENREVSTIGGSALFEITINGLLVASIASHLGLPDLFDTETGLSAIGRFGLMDGQSIFAYNGVFPPEPSAWEKIFLGWAEPETLSPGNYNISLVNKLAAAAGDTVILKVPINSTEYYLVENRLRDEKSDGAKLKYVLNGDTFTKTFSKDTTGFYSYAVDSIDGVVIDVDEFDWALPGSGILIWHIDENIINAKIADNKINADKDNRGVDLEEADGIQDIGEQFTTIFGDVVVAEGSEDDLWFGANPTRLFKNRFAKDTRPNTNSNSGANSLITFSNFSNIANKMIFNVSYGDSIIKPVFVKHLDFPSLVTGLSNISTQTELSFNVVADSLYRVTMQNVQSIGFSSFKSAVFDLNGGKYSVSTNGSIVHVYSYSDGQSLDFNVGEGITAPPVVRFNNNIPEILIGTAGNIVLGLSFAGFGGDPLIIDHLQFSDGQPIKKIAASNIVFYAITDSSFLSYPEMVPKISSAQNLVTVQQNKILDLVLTPVPVILREGNEFQVGKSDPTFFHINSPSEIKSFSAGDIKNDGNNYLLFTSGNNLEAVNLQGASADNFPFVDPQHVGFTGTPLSADFEGDSKAEIIAYTTDGRIFAIDGGTGKVVNGFPISTGAELAAAPVIFNYQGHTTLAAIDKKNNFYVWTIGADEGKLMWAEENGNNMNSSFLAAAENTNVTNAFFPSDKVYNYPNPVYGAETSIRYFVAEDSKISIKIFDLAGDFVAELSDDAQGGFDNETPWSVTGIQSGIYLARVEATSVSGKTENNIIKIAVVK